MAANRAFLPVGRATGHPHRPRQRYKPDGWIGPEWPDVCLYQGGLAPDTGTWPETGRRQAMADPAPREPTITPCGWSNLRAHGRPPFAEPERRSRRL